MDKKRIKNLLLDEFVVVPAQTDNLTDYIKKSDLTSYAQKSDISGFIVSSDLKASNIYFSENLRLNIPFGRFGTDIGNEYTLSCKGMTLEQLLSAAFTLANPEPDPDPDPDPVKYYWGTYDKDNYPDLDASIDNIEQIDLDDQTRFNSGEAFPQNNETITVPTGAKILIFIAPRDEWKKIIDVKDTSLHGPLSFSNDNRRIAVEISGKPYDIWYSQQDSFWPNQSEYEITWIDDE